MNTADTSLHLVVASVKRETDAIRSVLLVAPDGSELPAWTPGSHVDVHLPEGGHRAYSLVEWSADPRALDAPRAYRLGVRLAEAGGGGSRYVHSLTQGRELCVGRPRNRFALEDGPEPVRLLAGGIGITPLISMAARLRREDRPFEMVYAARSRTEMAFLAPLREITGDRLRLHADDEAGRILSVAELLRDVPPFARVYVCGPLSMIEAARAFTRDRGWPADRLRYELFDAPVTVEGDGGFTVVLARSGLEIQVGPTESVLDALARVGIEQISDCRRGDCGLCQVAVLEGIPDHRDLYLSPRERTSNSVMQVCVSRAKSPSLVLDL